MKVTFVVFGCLLLAVVSTANVVRNKRQTRPDISLDRCFDHWTSEIEKKVQRIQNAGSSLMTQLANLGKSDDANRRVGEQLKRYFDELNTDRNVRITSDQCDRQLQENQDKIMKSISDALNQLMSSYNDYLAEAAAAYNRWMRSIQQWFKNVFSGRG